MIENVTIFIDGQEFPNWKSYSQNENLDRIFANNSISTLDDPNLSNSIIYPQTDLKVFAGQDQMFNGRIDTYINNISSVGLDTENHSTNLTGRSYSAILHDSSPDNRNDVDVGTISFQSYIERLAHPFGIPFEIEGDSDQNITLSKINLISTIEREIQNGLSTLSGGSKTSTTNGGFKITLNQTYPKAGTISNIKSIKITIDEKQRFAKYEAESHSKSVLSPDETDANSDVVQVIDRNVVQSLRLTRKNVRGIKSEEKLREYAHYMHNIAYAKSRRIELEVLGWRDSSGQLIRQGTLVELGGPASNRTFVSDEWLIHSVNYKQSESNGTTCSLGLIKPNAYLNYPIPTDSKGSVLD